MYAWFKEEIWAAQKKMLVIQLYVPNSCEPMKSFYALTFTSDTKILIKV